MANNTEEGNVLIDSIRSHVLSALGRPTGLYETSVKKLWGNHYRINVIIGADPTAVRIAHSYFINAGEKGEILKSSPLITKTYH